jgi:hypothetical protein
MEVLRGYEIYILLALVVMIIIQFMVIMSLSGRVNKLATSFRRLLTGPTGEDLEALIHHSLDETRKTSKRCDDVDVRVATLREEMRGCLQHIGLVRFDAFHDVSGHQSFSLAMLDGNLNGTIITALFGRQDSRCYGKAVVEGRTLQALSTEEENALLMALQGGLAEYLNGNKNGIGRSSKKDKEKKNERSADNLLQA